jgi:hypothetical protein
MIFTGEAFSSPKENIQYFKTWNFLTFSLLSWFNFALPDPDPDQQAQLNPGTIGIRIRIRNIGYHYKKAKINYHKITNKFLTVPLHLSALKSLMNSAPRRGNIVEDHDFYALAPPPSPPAITLYGHHPYLSMNISSLCVACLWRQSWRGAVWSKLDDSKKIVGFFLYVPSSLLLLSLDSVHVCDVRSRGKWRFQVVENRSRTM